MAKTYNGRFNGPDEPKDPTKWLIAGIAAIVVLGGLSGIGVAIGVGCFIAYGRGTKERKLYRWFNEFCAVIGMHDRVSLKELCKISGEGKVETRKRLQQMISRGYFGAGAYLDVQRDELVLPPVQGHARKPESVRGGWKDVAFELLDALRGEKIFEEPAREAPDERPLAQETPQAKVQAEKTSAQEAPKPAQTVEAPKRSRNPAEQKKTYMDELERTLNELYQLNEQIADEGVSERIDRIGALTGGIFRAVIEKPEREQDARRFMNYYLPTTLKLLRSYQMLESQSYQGENIVASRKKIESVLDMLIAAFEKQLDRLFADDALDIATDVEVLETMMAGDGLSEKGQMRAQ